MGVNGITTFVYSRTKQNLTNSHYQTTDNLDKCQLLSSIVKVEQDRKFHKAKGFNEWFRTYGTSWDTGNKTGLKFSKTPNQFYGDLKVNNIRTLLIFKFSEDRQTLTVEVFPFGYYNSIK